MHRDPRWQRVPDPERGSDHRPSSHWSHSSDFVRLDIFFGTAYDDDPSRCAIAIEAAQTVKRVLGDPRAPVCHEMGFGDSSVDYTLRFWIMDPAGGLTNVRGAVYLALWDTFKANGVSIPFPRERCGCWRVRRNRA